MTIGILSLILAFAGVALPLLPTTPFLLLSAFCFARSSEKIHNWLVNHVYFGPLINDWRKNGSIGKKNKIFALTFIFITVLISILYGVPSSILALQILILSIVSLFIITRPQGS
ncbi:MAG: YbaN family protein [Pseudomonadota bacterium]